MNQNHHARRLQTPSASRKRKETTESDFGFDSRAASPDTSNWLLAGYMAHEFLTSGTMLGRKLHPGWAEVGPLVSPPVPQQHRPEAKKAHQSYCDVASMFKRDGTHVPGVVNPTQLAKWIQM